MMRAWVLSAPGAGEEQARVYRFRGAGGAVCWPMDGGARLGAAGMWNFLWRLGFHPRPADALPALDEDDVLFAQLDGQPPRPVFEYLQQRVQGGGAMVLAGNPSVCGALLGAPSPWRRVDIHGPYTGVAYLDSAARAQLVAPTGWSVARLPGVDPGLETVGRVATVGGERQSPQRAVVAPVADAPALVLRGRACFLNANPFAAFQSWLQGQDDLLPWIGWRHRFFWLDEWVSDIASTLAEARVLNLTADRPGVPGLGRATVVLRHDVDHSRDTAYLDDEDTSGVAGTHAVLLDRNRRFWVDRLGSAQKHECAFHYSSGERDWLETARIRMRGQRASVLRPARRRIAGHGLLRQVRRARAAGVGTATLHRHLMFMPYPEWVDALDAVFAHEAEVLGASSLFRAQILRWGRDRVDGQVATAAQWPDVQFPSWFPVRLAHAGDGGRTLRGWESASAMEPEAPLVDQLLRHRIPHISQNVFTLSFHPAHAAGVTFHATGSRPAFRGVLEVIRQHGIECRPLREVYARADAALASQRASV